MQLLLFLLTLMGQSAFITSVLYEYHYINVNKSWNEAQSFCRTNYTDLATVSNMADFNRISEFPQNEAAWIGLNREANANKVWHWSLPGVEFNDSDTKWRSGEGLVEGNENCGFLFENFEWGDETCENVENKKKTFFCYDENNEAKFHFINEKKSWVEAQKYCRENHTDLVSGLKQLEDVELKDLVSRAVSETTDASPFFWIGLFADTWTWSDENSFSFRNWDSLPADTSDRSCAATEKNSNKWKTYNYAEEKPFICYKDKMILIKESLSWEDAFYYCRENHRDLVSITNQVDQVWVQQKAKLSQTPFVWIGLRYSCVLDFWFWTSNQLVRYDNWAAGPTDNNCDLSGAMETEGEHKWFKKNMNEKMNFICN